MTFPTDEGDGASDFLVELLYVMNYCYWKDDLVDK